MRINHNSPRNQEIKRQFVEREVVTCISIMAEYILKKSWEDNEAPFTWDDVENYYVPKCPECGDTNSIEEMENEDGEAIYKCNYCEAEFDEKPEEEPQEVYEWWIVSSWLLGKLKEHGEVIIDHMNIWGRCTTGQAILLDGIISDICEELEILEGQKHEWK